MYTDLSAPAQDVPQSGQGNPPVEAGRGQSGDFGNGPIHLGVSSGDILLYLERPLGERSPGSGGETAGLLDTPPPPARVQALPINPRLPQSFDTWSFRNSGKLTLLCLILTFAAFEEAIRSENEQAGVLYGAAGLLFIAGTFFFGAVTIAKRCLFTPENRSSPRAGSEDEQGQQLITYQTGNGTVMLNAMPIGPVVSANPFRPSVSL